MNAPTNKTERHLMAFVAARYFTWPADREHGLSPLAAKRALRSLERKGLLFRMPPNHSAPNTYWQVAP